MYKNKAEAEEAIERTGATHLIPVRHNPSGWWMVTNHTYAAHNLNMEDGSGDYDTDLDEGSLASAWLRWAGSLEGAAILAEMGG